MKVTAEDLKEGYELPSVSKAVTVDKLKVFSAWSGKSLHADEEEAKKFGLPTVLAHGVLSNVYLMEALVKFFGADWLSSGKMDIASLKPVFAGDTVSTKVVIRSKQAEGGGIKVGLDVSCENQRGETVSAGTTSVLVRGEAD